MKKNKNMKLAMVTLSAILSATVFSTTHAQTASQAAPTFNPDQLRNEVGQSRLEGTSLTGPNDGNVFEREVTPLLRETSRKKSLLELKKLDAEIEKVDAEMLKLQREKLAPITTGRTNQNIGGFNLPPGAKIIDASNITNPVVENPIISEPPVIEKVETPPPVPATPPQMLPPMEGLNQLQQVAPVAPAVDNSNAGIRVLMTYGFADDLYAKITHGNQGGYVIRKGDILPNGKVVVKVTSNFIEVREPYTKDKEKNKKIKTQKIYVTGAPSGDKESVVSAPTPASESSASITPPGAFGDLSVPPMIEQVHRIPAPGQPKLEVTPLTGR